MGMMNTMGSGKGGGKGGGKRPAGGPPQTATVRYEDAGTAQRAVEFLNNSSMNGALIQVVLDPRSTDGRKLMVSNIPSEVAWQEIKDHFNSAGRVQFADMINADNITSTVCGTVRYFSAEEAQIAISSLNGSDMNGNIIEVKLHGGTKDQTKVSISGMPPGTEWQELKDYFGQIGQIAFAAAFNPDIKQTCEIRYDDPGHAQQALDKLNGSLLGGSPISIEPDQMDYSRLIIHGIPVGIAWQELKDHFKQIGTVAFSDIPGAKGSKGSKGPGKGGCGKQGGKGAGMKMMNPGGMKMMNPGGMHMMDPGSMNMMNPGGMVMISAEMFNEMMQGMGQSYGQAKGCSRGGCGAMGGQGRSGGGYGCTPYGGGHAPMGMVTNPMQSMAPMPQMNDPPGSGRVLVRGFDFATTEEQLLAHMGQAGQIFKADWITDGSIEVVYQTRAAAQQAMGLDKSTIAGNRRFIDVRSK